MTSDGMHPNHRLSVRLRRYDYSSPGAYFVTVVTNGFKCIFGKIIDKEMHNYHLGEIVSDCWFGIPDHFPGIEVEPFVLMPNHIHGIITILDDDRRGTINLDDERRSTINLDDDRRSTINLDDDRRGTIYRAPTYEEFGQPTVRSIPTIVRTFKAAVSRIANEEMWIIKIWQRNYYEHIIRNQAELEKIANYITSNPQNWLDDPENNL